MQQTNNSKHSKLRHILLITLTTILSIFLLLFLLLPLLPPIITIKLIQQPPTQPIENENLHQLSTHELQNLFTNRLKSHQDTMNNHRNTIQESLLNIDNMISGTEYLINHEARRYNKDRRRGVRMQDFTSFLKFVRTLDQGMESVGEEVLMELEIVERAQRGMQREVKGMGEFMEGLEAGVMRAMEV